MKTKEIAEKAKDLKYNKGIIQSNPHTIAVNSFVCGYEACDAEWQEKMQNVANYLEFEVHSDIADRVIQILNGEK